ncbi:DUF5074 domain-containing protein [Butyricimonas synergistica]|uniref:DUF5074 domain-containing protein n=1 Tax=Butyricimonas synergistica TaxID=544644 RepID=UPI0003704757|nr:DUF5074 domain-containing protein [Butyricimonas synergistica]
MKKFYLVLLFLGVLTGLVSSCSDDDKYIPTPPTVTIESANGSFSMLPTESIVLKAKVDSPIETSLAWLVNGEKVSTDSIYTFKAEELGKYNVMLAVSNADGKAFTTTMIEVHGKYKYGTFILNEGSRSPGSLIFIDSKGEITNNVYQFENGGELGALTQDLFIKDNKMYIVSQSGGYDGGFVTILNAETLKRERKFQEELEGKVSSPTHIAVLDEDNIYIRDGQGIKIFHPSTGEVLLVEGTSGARNNTMPVVNNKVFATRNNTVLVFEEGKDQIAKTITFEGNVSGVIKSSDNNLWVSDASGKISKVDANTCEILKANTLTGDAANELKPNTFARPATPNITAKGDTLYINSTSSKIYRHIFGENQTDFMVDAKTMVENVGQVYNTVAVNPKTGKVFMNTLKGWGNNYLINQITAFDFSGEEPEISAAYNDYTRFPAGIFFTYNFE